MSLVFEFYVIINNESQIINLQNLVHDIINKNKADDFYNFFEVSGERKIESNKILYTVKFDNKDLNIINFYNDIIKIKNIKIDKIYYENSNKIQMIYNSDNLSVKNTKNIINDIKNIINDIKNIINDIN